MKNSPLLLKSAVALTFVFLVIYLRRSLTAGSEQWQTMQPISEDSASLSIIQETNPKRFSIAYLMVVHSADTVASATELISAMNHTDDLFFILAAKALSISFFKVLENFSQVTTRRSSFKLTRGRCMDVDCNAMTTSPYHAVVVPSVNWVMFPYEFGVHVLSPAILGPWTNFLKWNMYPDESFWASILYSSPWRHWTVLNYHLFTYWNSPCRTYQNERTGSSPCYYGLGDMDVLYSSVYWIGRKVHARDPVKKYLRRWFDVVDQPMRAAEYIDYVKKDMREALTEYIEYKDTAQFNFTAFRIRKPPGREQLEGPVTYFRLENQNVTSYLLTERPFAPVKTGEGKDQWVVEANDEGHHTFMNRETKKYFGAKASGELSATEDDAKSVHQQWDVTSVDIEDKQKKSMGKFWTLRNVGTGKFLECTKCTNQMERQEMQLTEEKKQEPLQTWRLLPVRAF
ncbi:hypothetical protein PROFUN_11334 [Planoprotostelium fungivorum]|uniref:Uncharacterized protein n=1 Tax=Planoprotostelium fungivorum TaxID=1890364 RepID=A0A2P6NAC8_9EUKA|nr:hypothetical protein PROFUN_11334 [Planoprotostelium fungivorum]